MKMLIVYDIAHPRRINRVAKVLKDYGLRVQKSVFEVDVTVARFSELRRRVEYFIEPDEDGVKYLPLCGHCPGLLHAIGQAYEQPDGQFCIL